MKSYKIKSLQFQILPVLLETTQVEMSERLGVKPNYICRHLQDGEFKMCDIIAICNSYHIPMSVFISAGASDVYAGREILAPGGWRDIAFREDSIRKRLRKDGVSMNRVADTLCLSRNTANSVLSVKCPLTRFVDFCNAFGFNMGEFISDPTLPRISDESKELRKEVERLRSELIEARAAAFMAEQQLAELKARYAMRRRQDSSYEENENNPQYVAED